MAVTAYGKPAISLVEASQTRPANTTPYTDGDLIANDVDAADVEPMQFVLPVGLGRGIKIIAVKFLKSGTTSADANFRIHLFASEPTVSVGDNTDFSPLGVFACTESDYLGTLAVGNLTQFSDDCSGMSSLSESEADDINWKLESGMVIYGLMQANANYVPASAEVFTVTLVVEHY